MARRFASLPILGYELWNEPWAGDVWSHPSYLLPGNAGRQNLLPLYDKLAAGIAEYDNQSLIFFEPVTWGMFSSSAYLGSGFDRIPNATQARAVLSFHYYCWFFNLPNNIQKEGCDDLLAPDIFDAVWKDMREIGAVPFMTEWGSGPCSNCCDPSSPSGLAICYRNMELADKHFTSWTEWDWGCGDLLNGWKVNATVLELFARPYPQATAGIPQLLTFHPLRKLFDFCFTLNTSISAPTLLSVPFDVQYASGYNMTCSPGLSCAANETTNRVVAFPTKGAADGGQLCIHISPVNLTSLSE